MTKRRLLCGHRSIFRDKKGGDRLHGIVTKVGSAKFELHRARLALLASRTPDEVSDADTIEYLARGEADTRAYLKAHT